MRTLRAVVRLELHGAIKPDGYVASRGLHSAPLRQAGGPTAGAQSPLPPRADSAAPPPQTSASATSASAASAAACRSHSTGVRGACARSSRTAFRSPLLFRPLLTAAAPLRFHNAALPPPR